MSSLAPQELHLREIGLGGDHALEAFYRLLRPVHCNKRHAVTVPSLDRIGIHS
jgi:hypothetical protein